MSRLTVQVCAWGVPGRQLRLMSVVRTNIPDGQLRLTQRKTDVVATQQVIKTPGLTTGPDHNLRGNLLGGKDAVGPHIVELPAKLQLKLLIGGPDHGCRDRINQYQGIQ